MGTPSIVWRAPCGYSGNAETPREARLLLRQHKAWCDPCTFDYRQTVSDHITDEEE